VVEIKNLFEVNGKNRFENGKKMTISVYGVRTSENSKYGAEFLVYYQGRWAWTSADNYTPIDNKHS
jgi:hypothetical protein